MSGGAAEADLVHEVIRTMETGDRAIDAAGKLSVLEDLKARYRNPLMLNGRGELCTDLTNDFAACIPAYQNVIGLDASNVRAWLGLGFAYLHTGKNSLSMAAFQEAIRLDPSKKAALQPMLAKFQAP